MEIKFAEIQLHQTPRFLLLVLGNKLQWQSSWFWLRCFVCKPFYLSDLFPLILLLVAFALLPTPSNDTSKSLSGKIICPLFRCHFSSGLFCFCHHWLVAVHICMWRRIRDVIIISQFDISRQWQALKFATTLKFESYEFLPSFYAAWMMVVDARHTTNIFAFLCFV